MKTIEERIVENLPIGGKVVTLTRQLFKDTDDFRKVDAVLVKMSWGCSTSYIYKRVKK